MNPSLNNDTLHTVSQSAQGNLFYAVVTAVDPTTYHVTVAPQGNRQLQKKSVRILSSTMCNALGFKESYLPTVGSTVLCFNTAEQETVVIGMLPNIDIGDSSFSARTVIGAGDGLKSKAHRSGYGEDLIKTKFYNNRRPTDILQGEYCVSNEFGVLLGLFQQFACLKASELAQVQCFLLDDLVRIVSHNFQHFHSMGQFAISHDGADLTMEAGLTHNPREALGIPQIEKEQLRPRFRSVGQSTMDDQEDHYELLGQDVGGTPVPDEQVEAVERMKIFVGRLGDFVNLMLVVPADTVKSLNGGRPASFDSGVLQIKANLDGLFVIRSAKGIVIEKTNWIRVPCRVRSNEDPEGDDCGTKETPVQPDFQFDETYNAYGQPFLYYLQLRDYLSYVQDGSGYRHFTDRPLDFVTNDEFSKERPLTSLTYVDPVTGASYMKKTASVVLMPNGGVSMRDCWSSAINMEGGNIYLQPARDLVFQPMRHLIAKVGGTVSVAARRDIDLSSTDGGFRLTTNQVQYFYNQTGGIVMHTDTQTIGGEGFSPASEDEEPVASVSGIVMKAPNGGLFVNAGSGYQLYTGTVVTEANNNTVLAENNVLIKSNRDMKIVAATALINAANTLSCYSKERAWFVGEGQTVVGRADQKFGIVKKGDQLVGYTEGMLKETEENNFFREMDDLVDFYLGLAAPKLVGGINTQKNFDGLVFRFHNNDHYGELNRCALPQTLTQQEDVVFGLHNLAEWEERAINDTYPYPGKIIAGTTLTSGLVSCPLLNLEIDGGEIVNKTEAFSTQPTLDATANIFKVYKVCQTPI